MNTLKNLKKDTNKYALVYALFWITFVLYAVFLALEAIPTPTSSEIPNYSLDKIEKANKSLGQRKELDPIPETNLSQFEFGKTEPFR